MTLYTGRSDEHDPLEEYEFSTSSDISTKAPSVGYATREEENEALKAQLTRYASKRHTYSPTASAAKRLTTVSAAERTEAIGGALALAMGSNRPAHLHPDSFDIRAGGLGLDRLRTMIQARAIDSGAFTGTLQRGIELLAEEAGSEYVPEHEPLVTVHAVPNYREVEIGAPSTVDAGALEESSEGFVAAAVDPSIKASVSQVRDQGVHFYISRKTLINESMAMIGGWVREGVRACYRYERAAIMAALNANASLSDGVAVFHADRQNVITGMSDLTATTLESMMTKLRSLPTGDGSASNYKAGILLVPATHEYKARLLIASMDLSDTIFVLGDTALTDVYLLPSKAESASIVIPALAGNRIPTTEIISPAGMFDIYDPRASRDGLYLRIWTHLDAQIVRPTIIRGSF